MGLFKWIRRGSDAPKPPRPDPSVSEWTPPPALMVDADVQARALIAACQGQGWFGNVPHYKLTAFYKEVAWIHGFIEVPEQEILRVLGQMGLRRRPRPSKTVCYRIPGPHEGRRMGGSKGTVVPMRGRVKPQIREEVPWPELPANGAA